MKRMADILPAWQVDQESFNDPDQWDKGKLLRKLKEDGHTAVAVDRATLVIEQCEKDDDFPGGWSQNPLKISVYSDPDVTGSSLPQEIYIHAGRMGLMHLFLCIQRNGPESDVTKDYFRLVSVPAEEMKKLDAIGGDVIKAQTILRQLDFYLRGFYMTESNRLRSDDTLKSLAEEARVAVEKYIDYLKSLPNLHPGLPNPYLD